MPILHAQALFASAEERITPRDLEPNLSQMSHLVQFISKLIIFIYKHSKGPWLLAWCTCLCVASTICCLMSELTSREWIPSKSHHKESQLACDASLTIVCCWKMCASTTMASLKFPLQDPLQAVATSSNNHTTTISSKLNCFIKQAGLFIQHLLEIIRRVTLVRKAQNGLRF